MPDNVLATAGGVGLGAGSTIVVKRQFDAASETTVLRPSVLWGVGTGALAYVLPWLLDWRAGAKREFAEDYGEAAFITGIVSAVTPGGVQAPTL